MHVRVGDTLLVSLTGRLFLFRDGKQHGEIVTDKNGVVVSWGYSGPIADPVEPVDDETVEGEE